MVIIIGRPKIVKTAASDISLTTIQQIVNTNLIGFLQFELKLQHMTPMMTEHHPSMHEVISLNNDTTHITMISAILKICCPINNGLTPVPRSRKFGYNHKVIRTELRIRTL